MAAKKTPRKRAARRPRPAAGLEQRGRQAVRTLRATWDSALAALTQAQADLERQVRHLMKANRIDAHDARALLKSLNAALGRARKSALKEVEGRMEGVQARLTKERKVLGRAVDEAVQSALSALNIPSRREVAELTRKVEALSHKIDGLRR